MPQRLRSVMTALLLVLLTSCASTTAPTARTTVAPGPTPQQPAPTQPEHPPALGPVSLAAPLPLRLTRTPAPASDGPPTDLVDIAFRSESVGYGATFHGGLYRTEDGGVTWREVRHDPGVRYLRLQFAADQTGFALGHTDCPDPHNSCQGPPVLLRTQDGGASWERFTPTGLPPAADSAWSNMPFAFVDAQTGYAADPQAGLLQTKDGGQTWGRVNLPGGVKPTGGLQFLTPKRGFVTGTSGEKEQVLLTTADGGEHWQPIWHGEVPMLAVQFLNDQEGFIGGGSPHWRVGPTSRLLLATRDGGRSWTQVDRVDDYNRASPIVGLRMRSMQEGWILQERHPMLRTADGGKSWERSPGYKNTRTVSLAGNHIWVWDEDDAMDGFRAFLRRSADGGRTWETLAQRQAMIARAITFVSPTVGWLAAQVGVFRTANGGQSWQRTPVNPPPIGDQLFFAGEANLFAFQGTFRGGENDLLRSPDGGRTWTPLGERLDADPHIAFGSPQVGWLAYPNRRSGPYAPYPDILQVTKDGGATWTSTAAQLPVHSAIALADERHGVAAGGYPSSILTATADGGDTWSKATLPAGLFVRSVSYTRAGHLWLAGAIYEGQDRGGYLLHSPDRGATWQVYRFAGEAWGINFASPDEGWLIATVDGAHVLARTMDGGQTWTEVWPEISK